MPEVIVTGTTATGAAAFTQCSHEADETIGYVGISTIPEPLFFDNNNDTSEYQRANFHNTRY